MFRFSPLWLMLWSFAEGTKGAQVRSPVIDIPPEGHTAQVSAEVSEEEVPAEIAPLETPEATSALAVSVLSLIHI